MASTSSDESDFIKAKVYLENDIQQLKKEIKMKNEKLIKVLEDRKPNQGKEETDPMRATLRAKEGRLKAQLKALKQYKMNALPDDPFIILLAMDYELEEAIKQQEKTLFMVKEQQLEEKMKHDLETIEAKISQDSKLVKSLQANLIEIQKKAEAKDLITDLDSENAEIVDLKKSILKTKLEFNDITSLMQDFMETHFPALDENGVKRKEKSNQNSTPINSETKSLQELVEIIFNAYLENPQDSYVKTDATWWPPYVELLLRYNIAVSHPTDSTKLRLEVYE